MHPSIQRPGAPPFSGMLPGINSMDIVVPGGPGVPGTAGGPGAPSYLPPGASAPSRTHSPSTGASQQAPLGTAALLAPHGHPPAMFQPLDVPGSGSGHGMVGIIGFIPSVSELERHYAELEEQKKRMEEMLERTEKMMQGVKRGISEMRAGTGGAPGSRPPSTAPGAQTTTATAPSVPLQRPASNAAGEKDRRETVWTVVDTTARSE